MIKLNINKIMNNCLLSKKIKINNINDYNFDFLNNLDTDVSYYYNIINGYEEFKLKNIYKFIYNRILKLSDLYNIKKMKNIKNRRISFLKFNELMNDYIDNDKILSIIIINSLSQYFNPNLNF